MLLNETCNRVYCEELMLVVYKIIVGRNRGLCIHYVRIFPNYLSPNSLCKKMKLGLCDVTVCRNIGLIYILNFVYILIASNVCFVNCTNNIHASCRVLEKTLDINYYLFIHSIQLFCYIPICIF